MNKPHQFRKKPVVIEAVQFVGGNHLEIAEFMNAASKAQLDISHLNDAYDDACYLIIPTLEGDHKANVGDWIIKGVNGEFYPCKPDIFAKTYDVVIEDTLPPHQQRLTHEREELSTKAAKLSAFILDNPAYKELTPAYRYAMDQQYKAQCLYLDALDQRLELVVADNVEA